MLSENKVHGPPVGKTPELLKQYGNIIAEQERKGFIERVPEDDNTSHTHYIPHHPVRKESSTTPIRIVYDCSCKQSHDSPSLNDCLHAGPPFLNDLSAILLRFRQHSFAFSADIEKAFLHVFLDETDRDDTRFLWLSDPNNPSSPFDTYRFKVVLFGATSSPFMLNATLKFHLARYANATSEDLLHNLYVDNLLSGCDSEEAAIQYFTEARAVLGSAGFNLRSWSSNSSSLQTTASQHQVCENKNPVKVLGMFWNTETDSIHLSPCSGMDNPTAITKREVLRWSSTIFDPLGLITPVTISAKLFLQQLWQKNISWDTTLNHDLFTRWMAIAHAITDATTLSLCRKYSALLPIPQSTSTYLHVFADASFKAYGAVAYIQQDNGSPSFVISKSRAAPLKQLTLPRLELKAAVLAAKLSSFVKTSLSLDCTVQLWSDSQIVLHWISSLKPLQPFVNRRVVEIRAISSCWKYCPSTDNPADLLTRGITAEQLRTSVHWLHGPTWLPTQQDWPTWDPADVLLTCLELQCVEHSCSDQTVSPQKPPAMYTVARVIDINNYSNLTKLLAVTAYVLRFTNNAKHTSPNSATHLSPAELSLANMKWVHAVQHEQFSAEIQNLQQSKSPQLSLVRQLRLFLDNDMLLRCGGRIHNAPLSELAKFPYLLPPKHHFTNLVILQAHTQLHHSGVNATLTLLRQRYWIPSGRQRVRSLLRKCVTCKKVAGKPYAAPDPPPLVKDQLNASCPFEVTGVDYTGALYVHTNSGEQRVYICLFTCAVSRTIHLEIVCDLTLQCFLQAFRRFVSRRSLSRLMLLDNISTYQAAAEELQTLFSSAALSEDLARRGVKWQFIPKRAHGSGAFGSIS